MWSYPENAPHSWTVVKPSYIGQVKSKPNDSIVSTQTCRHSQTHTPCIHCTNNPHTGSIHTHTCIQHTICCMQFINFMGVIFEEFCIYICNCWHSVQVLILLVKYIFANLQVLVVLLFSHSQALSWCSEFLLRSCTAAMHSTEQCPLPFNTLTFKHLWTNVLYNCCVVGSGDSALGTLLVTPFLLTPPAKAEEFGN